MILLSTSVFAWTAVRALLYAPDSELSVPLQAIPITSATSSQPARLIIPSLSIDAAVQRVGVTVANAMGTPNNFVDVGWYKYGPVPGAFGSAVIDGHVDNGLSLDGVFKHLSDIALGADVYVVANDGSKKHFVVIDIEVYPYHDAPSDTIFDRNDAARLNLITCDGEWVPGDRTYDQRLVVYTELSAT